jgi:hypothetical protein
VIYERGAVDRPSHGVGSALIVRISMGRHAVQNGHSRYCWTETEKLLESGETWRGASPCHGAI